MQEVYFIGGLGADKRVFSLLDLSFCQPVFLEWLVPVHSETLEKYALRLKAQIKEPRPVIVGLSFGGMLVTEMAKADPDMKGIIISSNKTASEFPSQLRLGKYFPAYQWMPATALTRIMTANSWILGGKGKEQKHLLRQIIIDTDAQFVKWAIGAILRWSNQVTPPNLVQIHGTADKLLPIRCVKPDFAIEGGTHVMTLDNDVEISNLLKKLILKEEIGQVK